MRCGFSASAERDAIFVVDGTPKMVRARVLCLRNGSDGSVTVATEVVWHYLHSNHHHQGRFGVMDTLTTSSVLR